MLNMINYTVWVGGVEVNDYLLTKPEAEKVKEHYENLGYNDVVMEEIA